MQDKVQALVRLSEAERAQSRSANSIDSLQKQNQDLTHRLTQATQEKVNALMQLADGNSSHGAAGGKGVVPSPQKAPTWKVQLTRVNLFWPVLLCCAVWCLAFAIITVCCAMPCCAVLCCVVLCCAVLAYLYCMAFAVLSSQAQPLLYMAGLHCNGLH